MFVLYLKLAQTRSTICEAMAMVLFNDIDLGNIFVRTEEPCAQPKRK